jgi:hypothetical protein
MSSIRLLLLAPNSNSTATPRIYIWMPGGIYRWMLWPRGRGIYPQMLPPAIRLRYRPGAQAEHGAIVPQFHPFRIPRAVPCLTTRRAPA